MKIKTIKYSRKFSLGNYETEDISLEADISEEEKAEDCIEELRERVEKLGRGI